MQPASGGRGRGRGRPSLKAVNKEDMVGVMVEASHKHHSCTSSNPWHLNRIALCFNRSRDLSGKLEFGFPSLIDHELTNVF